MCGRRLPLNGIPQWETEAFPLDHDLVAFVENHTITVTGDAAAQEMDMDVPWNPVRLEFEMMLLDLCQLEGGMLLASSDFLGPYRRTHAVDGALHRHGARHVLEFGIERQLRPDRAITELSPREQARVPAGRNRIGEFVSRGQTHAPGNSIRTDKVYCGEFRFLRPAGRETRNGQRLSMGAQMHAVPFGKPRRRRGHRISGWHVSIRASRNQAASSVIGMIEAGQETPAAAQSMDLAIIQNNSG